MADAERISGGVTRLETGTLHMALDRLSSAGLVDRTGRRSPTGGCAGTTGSPTTARPKLAADAKRRRASAAVAAQRLTPGSPEASREPGRGPGTGTALPAPAALLPSRPSRAHREEMLGVLLAAARPGRRCRARGKR